MDKNAKTIFQNCSTTHNMQNNVWQHSLTLCGAALAWCKTSVRWIMNANNNNCRRSSAQIVTNALMLGHPKKEELFFICFIFVTNSCVGFNLIFGINPIKYSTKSSEIRFKYSMWVKFVQELRLCLFVYDPKMYTFCLKRSSHWPASVRYKKSSNRKQVWSQSRSNDRK